MALILSLFGVYVCHVKFKKKHRRLQRDAMSITHVQENQSYDILQSGTSTNADHLKGSDNECLALNTPHIYDYIQCESQVSAVGISTELNAQHTQTHDVTVQHTRGRESDTVSIYDYIDDKHNNLLMLETNNNILHAELHNDQRVPNQNNEQATPVSEDVDTSSSQCEDIRLEANSAYAVRGENEPALAHKPEQATHVVEDIPIEEIGDQCEDIRLEVNNAYAAPGGNIQQPSPARNFEQVTHVAEDHTEARGDQREYVSLEANSAYAVPGKNVHYQPDCLSSLTQAALLVVPVAEELGDGFGHLPP